MSLRGLSADERARLMRWGTTNDRGICSVATKPEQAGHRDVCGRPAEWEVEVEDAEAGIDRGWGFEPASSSGTLCQEHAERLTREPRVIFAIRHLGRKG